MTVFIVEDTPLEEVLEDAGLEVLFVVVVIGGLDDTAAPPGHAILVVRLPVFDINSAKVVVLNTVQLTGNGKLQNIRGASLHHSRRLKQQLPQP